MIIKYYKNNKIRGKREKRNTFHLILNGKDSRKKTKSKEFSTFIWYEAITFDMRCYNNFLHEILKLHSVILPCTYNSSWLKKLIANFLCHEIGFWYLFFHNNFPKHKSEVYTFRCFDSFLFFWYIIFVSFNHITKAIFFYFTFFTCIVR